MTTDIIIKALVDWAGVASLPCDRSLGGDIAIFSPERLHRYVLTRRIGTGDRMLAGIGANPSTADAFRDDPTIKRGMGFGAAWGCGLYVMLNAYGWRATDPRDMWDAERTGADIVGRWNDAAISLVLAIAVTRSNAPDVILPAWGKIARPERAQQIAELARLAGRPMHCLGTNADGSPKHPLYLAANTEPRPWPT